MSRSLLAASALAALASVACDTVDPVRTVNEQLPLIEQMPPKKHAHRGDRHAKAILALGKAAVPALVDRFTDTSPSLWSYAFPHRVGDNALTLADEICRPKSWPFADGSRSFEGDYRDYFDLVESPGGREAIQRSWRNYLASGGCDER